ncbi:hypothetical protein [Bordetella sp. H567]|uniref:hypothetical protein n=1 Tax=Bordetella sp. H567 TaxID=1697043 RepID=UPI0009F1D10C|nr:hypothetical protein [Bordetella sp. H567]
MAAWGLPGWAWAVILVLVLSVVQVGFMLRGELRRRAQDAALVARQDQVRQTGRPGTGVVIRTTDTGTRLGAIKFFVIDITLRVEAQGAEPAFDATLRVPVSPVRLAEFAEGRIVRVRVNPDTREVALDQRTE